MNPLTLLREAIKAVPALKYALAVAGVAAVVAIVLGLRLNPQMAVFGSIIVIGLMFILVIFSQYAGSGNRQLRGPASLLVWFFSIALVVTTTLLITGYFLHVPNLAGNVERSSQAFSRAIHFKIIPFSITPSPTLKFGFSSLERDATLTSREVRITKLTVTMKTLNRATTVCCDVWMFLGPAPFEFPEGKATVAQMGSYPWDVNRNAPTQVKLNLGRPGSDPGSHTYVVTYNFATETCAISPTMGCAVKAFKNLQMVLPDGLYAQVFVWTGFQGADMEIADITLDVEGVSAIGHEVPIASQSRL